jgi:hypothetical protein
MKLRLKDTGSEQGQGTGEADWEWKKTGVITSEVPTESTSAPAASSSAPAASASAPSPTTTAPPRAAPVGGGGAGIPRKPSAAVTCRRWPTCAGSWSGSCAGKYWYSGCRRTSGLGGLYCWWGCGVCHHGCCVEVIVRGGQSIDGGLTFQAHELEARHGRGRHCIYCSHHQYHG